MPAQRLLRFLVPLVSCVFALLIVELALVLFYPIPYALEQNMYFQPDPYTGYRHAPLGAGHYAGGIPANANSQGNRDAAVLIPKPANTKRILVLGNSFTVGANVAQPDVYPQVLEKMLTDAVAAPIEVVNSGVGGWRPFQYAQYFEHYGKDFEPDLIVIGFYVGRDMYAAGDSVEAMPTAVLGRRIQPEHKGEKLSYLRVWLYQHAHIVRALMNRGAAEQHYERDSCDSFSDFYLRLQAGRIYNHIADPEPAYRKFGRENIDELERIRILARRLGAPLMVLIIPDEMQLNSALQAALPPTAGGQALDYAMPQRLLQAMLDERGIPYLDLQTAFRNETGCLYMDDTHWNAAGHHLAAIQLHDYLLTHYGAVLNGRQQGIADE